MFLFPVGVDAVPLTYDFILTHNTPTGATLSGTFTGDPGVDGILTGAEVTMFEATWSGGGRGIFVEPWALDTVGTIQVFEFDTVILDLLELWLTGEGITASFYNCCFATSGNFVLPTELGSVVNVSNAFNTKRQTFIIVGESVSVVPEPPTSLLLGIGLAVLLGYG